MKLTVILGSFLMSAFAMVFAAQAGTITNSGAAFHAQTKDLQPCVQYNNEGWVWYNYTAGTACNGSTLAVEASISRFLCSGSQAIYVDGNCGSAVTCTAKLVGQNGSTIGTPSTATSSGSGNFDLGMSINCSDITDKTYETVVCTLPPGCKIWGVGANF
jgi:hypothetical protein